MPRIKKAGLDYFPLDTDFIRNRILRRIGKSHGEAAILSLLQVKSLIYGGKGYYVELDPYFFDDLSDQLYSLTVEQLQEIIDSAVALGYFDARLYREANILTSAEIQRQYLACTTRRTSVTIDERYRLLTEEEMHEAKKKSNEGTAELYQGTQSKAKESKEKQTKAKQSEAKQSEAKETSSSMVPPESGVNPLQPAAIAGGGFAAGAAREEKERSSEAEKAGRSSEESAIWQRIRQMTPPDDGLDRNFEGLLLNLEQFRIPAKDSEAIIKLSQYGRIGNPVWQGFCDLRSPKARFSIKMPGKFLISKCRHN